MGALYRLEFHNGKSYIGITAGTAEGRFKEHVYNAVSNRVDRAVNRALRKYGAESVKCRTLVIASDWPYLQMLEQKAIESYGTFGQGGYNMTAGGEGSLGHVHDECTLQKMRDAWARSARRARHVTPHSEKSKAVMSMRRKGKKLIGPQLEKARINLAKNSFDPTGTKQSAKTVAKRTKSMVFSGKGVSWDAGTSKWRAHISIGGKMKNLGRFMDHEDALNARQAAVASYLESVA